MHEKRATCMGTNEIPTNHGYKKGTKKEAQKRQRNPPTRDSFTQRHAASTPKKKRRIGDAMEQCPAPMALPATCEFVAPPLPAPAGGRALLRHAFPQSHRASAFYDRPADIRRTRKTKGGECGDGVNEPTQGRPVWMPIDATVDLFVDRLINTGTVRFDRGFDGLSAVRFDVSVATTCYNARSALVDALATSVAVHFISAGQESPPLLLASLGDEAGRLAVLVSARSDIALAESMPVASSTSCVLLVPSLDDDTVRRTVDGLRDKGFHIIGLLVLFSSHPFDDAARTQALGLPAVVLVDVATVVDRAHRTGRLDVLDVRRARTLYAARLVK